MAGERAQRGDSMTGRRELDADKLKEYAKRVFGALGGAMTSSMIYLGDRLGLYAALAESGAATSEELAGRTQLDERWVREWLYQQGAAGVLEHRGGGRFELTPEGCAVLADESHPAFGGGFFSHLPETLAVAERLPESFRSGLGQPYDALGPGGARGIERGLASWFRALLVPALLPRVDGVVEQLTRGARVADVGCGAGVALIEMARAFPKSEFHGYEISIHALERAERNLAESGVANARFHHAERDPLPEDGSFSFIVTFDCLHDMARPAQVMAQIRRSIAPDGTWLIADVKSHATYDENVERNPMAAMMYGTSVLTCLSSALSEPGGLGLGTLGLHPELARRMTAEAGFTRFEAVDLRHPVNAFYAVRP
jgi:2-polyprenyl-3-methyl-5-hydroxy-6-metoxy-1,4-benzoquinol methylase